MAKAIRRPASLSRSVCTCLLTVEQQPWLPAVCLFQLFSSSFESPQHICGYFVDLFCWKKFLGGVWKQKGMWISFSSVRNMRRACGRSVWQLPTSAPGRALSSCFPPTPAFHRCRTQRCSEPSDRPTHRSLQFFLVIFIFDT